eukprot:10198357-Prorocentrum_lima.AAC.1
MTPCTVHNQEAGTPCAEGDFYFLVLTSNDAAQQYKKLSAYLDGGLVGSMPGKLLESMAQCGEGRLQGDIRFTDLAPMLTYPMAT